MSIRIFHTADLHLGSEYRSFGDKAKELQQECLNAFEKMAGYVTNPLNGIHIMIIAGDLFDTHRPDLPLAEKVQDLLLQVVRKGITLFVLPGNHDSYSYKNSIYRAEDFPGHVIQSPEFTLAQELNINGQLACIYSGIFDINNSHKRMLNDFKLIQKPGAHIGILHATLEMREIDIPERELPFSYEEFRQSGLNYLALGHFHGYFEKQTDQAHKFAYPGTIIPRKINEYGEKYACVVEIKLDNSVRIEKLQFSKVRSEKRNIDLAQEDITDMKTLLSAIKKRRDAHLILDLVLEGVADFSIDESLMKERLKDDFFHVRITNNVKYVNSSIIDQLKDEETIRGLFFKKLAKHKTSTPQEQAVLNQAMNLGLKEFVNVQEEKEPAIKVVDTQDIMEID
ncbi:MAG: DNA repair exonuclease [bacterium]|nr:DNA repair exonuclease [bacterium]